MGFNDHMDDLGWEEDGDGATLWDGQREVMGVRPAPRWQALDNKGNVVVLAHSKEEAMRLALELYQARLAEGNTDERE